MKYTALAESKKYFRSIFFLINSTLQVSYDIKKNKLISKQKEATAMAVELYYQRNI